MNRPFNKIWKETLLIALCFLILGGFLIVQPEMTQDFFSFVSGALVLMLGILSFIKHRGTGQMITFDLAYAIVCIIGAIILFINRDIVFQIVPWVLGAVMIANSIFKVRYIFELKNAHIQKWYISVVLTLLKLLLGIAMILEINLFNIDNMLVMIGILVILFAICDVVDLIFIKAYLDEPISEKECVKRSQELIDADVDVKEIECDGKDA